MPVAAGAEASDVRAAVAAFQPHLTVLVLRHPAQNFASLNSKV